MKKNVHETLKERGEKYGTFAEQGRIEQAIKSAFQNSPNWPTLRPDAKSALEMIATKISRVLKGDPDHHDTWHDIGGYALLVADRIEETNEKISKIIKEKSYRQSPVSGVSTPTRAA